MTAALLLPLFGHFALVVGLYVVLTLARLVVVKRGEATPDCRRASSAIWPISSKPRSLPGSGPCC